MSVDIGLFRLMQSYKLDIVLYKLMQSCKQMDMVCKAFSCKMDIVLHK